MILAGSIFTAVQDNLCAAASGFSDATAPGLTATSALTT
ncbi:hypothetical protein ACRFBW_00020 [Klebsiella pneumoniae]|nr:hypothetical protein [Klebsiella pneumoniae]HDU3906252.1 hypothetical protein [Klebsiella pneumoniae subsp. pneumoniae]EKW7372008.1 hypothetical protein [Klebsiella pneumoniae]EKZ5939375.1 hypothetical protein [Klebsiella pneumoniae]MBG2534253.1 hypothetical protein [Klebsiella pneumoniae]MBX9263915.1 hypothetical protein [Klebsiella pneumoniae]